MENKILEIAKSVRCEVLNRYGESKSVCLEASRMLKKELEKNNFKAEIIQGKFKIDEPDSGNYTDWDEGDFNSNEEMNSMMHTPLHYWVEVDNKLLDITADQFQRQVIYDELEEITYGSYDSYPRYLRY